MFTAKSCTSQKTKSEKTPGHIKSQVATADRVQANPLWRSLALQPKLVLGQVDDPYEREADRVAEAIVTGKGRARVMAATAATSVVQRQPVDDVQKPREQPTTFPPQEASKQGQEKEDYEKEKLLEGVKKAAGELAKYLWGQFSTSQAGKNILDKNEHDLKPLIKFFEDFAESLFGKIVLGTVAAGGAAGAFAGAQSARGASGEPETSPSTGGPVPRTLKDEKFFSLELKWDFVTPPASFTLKTPWFDTPPIGGRSSSSSSTSLPPSPPLLTFKPLQIPRICTPADPNGDQGEADMRSAIVFSWLKYREEQEQKRQEELLKKYADWPKPGSLWGQPYSVAPLWQPSVLKPLFKRQDGAEELHDPQTVDTGLRSSGRPLDPVTQAYMTLRFGHDFSAVRVHTDEQAAESAWTLHARAYTLGRDLVFGRGQYQPQTDDGRRLLAHELAHVVQQSGRTRNIIRRASLSDFNDSDPLHDPSRLTDAQIRGTEEYRLLITFSFGPLPQQFVTPEEALLACRLILRHLREGGTVNRNTDGDMFIGRAKRQLGVLRSSERQVGGLNWAPFSTTAAVSNPSALPTEFGRWVLAGGPEPNAMSGTINCWEMILFGAYKGRYITFARIQSIYNLAVENVRLGRARLVGDTVEAQLRRGRVNIFDPTNPNSPEPLPGDMVIFNNAATHAAISLGTKNSTGEHEVLSLWNQPNAVSQVQRTTIEALLTGMGAGSGRPVRFWSANWD